MGGGRWVEGKSVDATKSAEDQRRPSSVKQSTSLSRFKRSEQQSTESLALAGALAENKRSERLNRPLVAESVLQREMRWGVKIFMDDGS